MSYSYEYEYEYYEDLNATYLYYDTEPIPHLKSSDSIIAVIFSYVIPIVAIATLLTNSLVVGTFSTKSMRSATTLLLIALAIADSCVCISVLPSSIYFYSMGHYKAPVPYNWCFVDHYLGYSIQRIFRSTSNWITLALGAQRFVIVCWPMIGRKRCTRCSSIAVSVAAFIFSISIELFSIISIKINEVHLSGNSTVDVGCMLEYQYVFLDYFLVYYVINGVFSKLLPCYLLLILTICLIYKLHARSKIIGHNASNSGAYEERVKKITSMVLAVAIVFFLAEIQDAIAFSIYIYEMAIKSPGSVLPAESDAIWDSVGFLLSVLGYHCNFWIYIAMSRQFRTALRKSLVRMKLCRSDDQERTSSSYLPDLKVNTKTLF